MNNNMNIAILTLYHGNTNYGALLQAYALQKALSDLEVGAKQISYELSSGYPSRKRRFSANQLIPRVSNKIKRILWNRKRKKRDIIIQQFADEIPHTELVTADTIAQLNEQFDLFVCGSDQIWNPIGWQPTLFLDFVTTGNKKVSYAASMARNDLSESEKAYATRYLTDFYAISVREERSAEILNDILLDKKVKIVPDPVFLLPAQEWEKMATPNQTTQPFVFVYLLGDNISHREQAKRFALENHLVMQYIPYLNFKAFEWDNRNTTLFAENQSVESFLELIYDAKVVITDSFHAAAFSMIFGTRVFVLKRFREGDPNSMNSRLESLMKTFYLTDNLAEVLPQTLQEIKPQAKTAMNILQKMRASGVGYLRSNCISNNK
ncbi:polysaccharide pyruvyl transferase family protein [Lapidilactobacillus luobeiensis]|uniref:polysaccharide pyruvyl transferase family protein n=1 Tax=Lapidilactobacillus luobeiensis TaxID=2950371 RepID=UPI0021C4ADDC|nr:polysaccharide pyruvyl transferase family protein [Lapidilactobacillus luobeiensis]